MSGRASNYKTLQEEQQQYNYPQHAPGQGHQNYQNSGPGYPFPGVGFAPSAPDDDPIDDATRQPTAPPPPDMSDFPQFAGYTIGAAIPAPAMPPPPSAPPEHHKFQSCAQLTEDECREALLNHVAQFCCYGKGPARDMDMKDFLASTALRYKLETFCEGRKTDYEFVPFRGTPANMPLLGVPPGAWDIPVQPDYEFRTHVKRVEVPHTSSVRNCHGCVGCGMVQCHRCHGRGRVRCSWCHGSGRRSHSAHDHHERETCPHCNGYGRKECLTCAGDGRVPCSTCHGSCRLRWFLMLTVSFTNHDEDFILETTDLPDHLVRNVQANVVYTDTNLYCWPITGYPVREIGSNSAELIEKHKRVFQTERRLNQRQTLLAIPVTEVHYRWKEKDRRYWVYGLDRQVYITDYPAKCCCGCSIL